MVRHWVPSFGIGSGCCIEGCLLNKRNWGVERGGCHQCDAFLSSLLLILISVGACNRAGNPTQSYLSLLPTNPLLEEVQPTLQHYIDAQFCGASATGLVSIYSAQLALLAKVAHLPAPNDGLVELFSCQLPDKVCRSHRPILLVFTLSGLVCELRKALLPCPSQPC